MSTLDLLHDKDLPVAVGAPDKQYLMESVLGATTIRESPLVMFALQDDTTPRNGTLYLEVKGPSWSTCAGIMPVAKDIYTDTFLRSVYNEIVLDTQYNLTFMAKAEMELVVPLVDCASSAILLGYLPTAKFNFLVRKTHDPNEVGIVTVQLSNQEYRIRDQSERGAAGVATLTYVTDMRAHDVPSYFIASIGYPYVEFDFRVFTLLGVTNDNMWELEMVPDPTRGDIPKTMETAFRSGFYRKSETEQFNINNQVNVISHIPIKVITEWTSINKTVMHDSWGWVHVVQTLLGLDLLLNLAVLLLVILRNLQAGKFWIGDAFVSISTTILFRGALIVVSWYTSGFWTLYEFCVSDAYTMLGVEMNSYSDIIYADLLGLYLSLCGLAGMVFRERVDPLYSVLSFIVGYELRGKLIHALPKIAEVVGAYGYSTFVDGVPPYQEGQETISPMGFWTSHELHGMTPLLVVQTLSPLLLSLVLILAYILGCKAHHYFYPDKARVLRNTTDTGGTTTSGGEEMMLTQKRVLTLFEIATGAELESRFGLMSSYEKHLFIKGMKFASADGIYSNGFVIANGKYLLEASDYWSIVLVKLTHWRFRAIYVYEITGSTVQQTARLVYPHTFSWTDLMNLNISVLS